MRLIDADAIPEVSWDPKEEAAFRSTIEEMPTIEAEPVRHGQWEVVDQEEPRTYGCSECKRLARWPHIYCPNCGARMEGWEE